MKSFLLIGQSNMAGRGDFGEVPEIVNDKCFMLRNGRFIPMSEPVNVDRPIFSYYHSGVGLAASFADEYAKFYGEAVGLIPCAEGGTYLSEWQPGEIFYDNAVCQARLASRSSEIVGILWHQGENDTTDIKLVEAYLKGFMTMINTLISDLQLPKNIPVIVGEIGDFVEGYLDGRCKYFKELNSVLKEIADSLESGGIASSKGLTCRSDNIHFDSKSYRELGHRYFEEYKRIVLGE